MRTTTKFLALLALVLTTATGAWAQKPAAGKALAAPAREFTARPVTNPLASAVRTAAPKKAPRRAPAATTVDELTGTYILRYYGYYDDAYLSGAVTVEKGEEDNTIVISNWWTGGTSLTATVDLEAGTVTIPFGQTFHSTYSISFVDPTEGESEALVGQIDGTTITFEDFWGASTDEGFYEVGMGATLARPNGVMTTSDGSYDVLIIPDEENNTVTVCNFNSDDHDIVVHLRDHTFAIESQLLYSGGSTYGDFYTYMYEDGGVYSTIFGEGTETTLMFEGSWTAYAPSTGYWYGEITGTSITLTDGTTFTYPTAYEISVGESEHGLIAFSPYEDFVDNSAVPGETVTIFIGPEDFYAVETVTANTYTVDEDGNIVLQDELELTEDEDGNFTFTMPAANVVVSATYRVDITDLSESESNAETYEEIGEGTANIRLDITLEAGQWHTIALPFAVEAEDIAEIFGEDTEIKSLASASFLLGKLTFAFEDAESIEAGKPYLIKVAETVEEPAFPNVTLSTTPVPAETDQGNFVPTFGLTTVGAEGADVRSILFVGGDNKLYSPETLPAEVKGFRAYFTVDEMTLAAVNDIVATIDGEEVLTGIRAIPVSAAAANGAAIYTLDGRRVAKAAQPGVYVVNGSKVVL